MNRGKIQIPALLTFVITCIGLSFILLTVVVLQRQTNTRSKASSPTGTAFMCIKGVSGFTTAETICSNSAPTTLNGTYDPDTGKVVVKLDLNTVTKPIVAWGVMIAIPATNLNQPIVTINSVPFASFPWQPLSFNGITNANNQWLLQYAYRLDLSGGASPQVLGGPLTDQTLMTIELPIKKPSPIPSAISWKMSFDTTQSLAQVADVNSTDILRVPANTTITLNKDTVGPTVNVTSGPANNTTVSNPQVQYVMTYSDNMTPAGSINICTAVDSGSCTPVPSSNGNITVNFVTQPGTHAYTYNFMDTSGNITPITRTLTFSQMSNVKLRVKFAGISSDRGPISGQVTLRTIDKTTYNPGPTTATFNFVSGAYETNLTNLSLPTGNYEILVKGPSGLRTLVTRSTGNVAITTGISTTIDRTSGNNQAAIDLDTVKAGDVCKLVCTDGGTDPNTCSLGCVDGQDGNLTFGDLLAISARLTANSVPIVYSDANPPINCPTNTVPAPISVPSRIDVNRDCVLSLTDLNLIGNNFTSSKIIEDQ